MAIDQQIQEKVDAYRNNPEALQKNYQMNQDLLDLLALQKIKSEKDAAARELQMSMEQDPQTIAGQRGEEAIGRTKDDLVKQVGGVAQTLASRQQQNMQRTAAGVASQPAPNMRMAGGGIVSFAPGGAVTETQLIDRMRMNQETFDTLPKSTQDKIKNRILSVPDPSQFERGADAVVRQEALSQASQAARSGRTDPYGIRGFFAPGSKASKITAADDAAVAESNRLANIRRNPTTSPPPLPSASNFGPQGEEEFSLEGQGGPLSTQPQVRQISKQSNSNPTLADPTLLQTDKEKSVADVRKEAEEGRTRRMKETAENLNRSGVAKIRAEQLTQQKALSEKNAADRKENRFYDLLARAGGQGALADIGRAGSDLRQGDRMQSQLDLDNLFERQDKGIADDITIGKAEIQSGDNYEKIVATTGTAELNRISDQKIANLDAKTKVRVENFKALIQQRTDALKVEADRATNSRELTKTLAKIANDMAQKKIEVAKEARESLTQRALFDTLKDNEVEAAIQQEAQRLGLMVGPELKRLENLYNETRLKLSSGFGLARLKSS